MVSPDELVALRGSAKAPIIHEVDFVYLLSRILDQERELYREMTPEGHSETLPASTWAFLTNHAHVLLCIARDPQARARDIAEQVGITERGTQRILADLIADGYVARTKVGRRNHYTINPRGHLRHPVLRDLSIGPLLDVLNANGTAEHRQKPHPDRRP